MSKQPAYLRKCECGELFGSDDANECLCDFCREIINTPAEEVENENYIWDDVASYYPNERFGDLNEELDDLEEDNEYYDDVYFDESDPYSPDFDENTDLDV
jgi:hypothetical protein